MKTKKKDEKYEKLMGNERNKMKIENYVFPDFSSLYKTKFISF